MNYHIPQTGYLQEHFYSQHFCFYPVPFAFFYLNLQYSKLEKTSIHFSIHCHTPIYHAAHLMTHIF